MQIKRLNLQGVVNFFHAHYAPSLSWADVRRTPHIEGWLDYLHHGPWKPNTRAQRIGDLRKFLEDMLAWQWPQPPAPGLIRMEDFPPEEHLLPKPLPQDLDQAVKQALAGANTLPALGLRLLRLTGMRIGEMVDMELNALDQSVPQRCTLHVPMGKTRTERVIPVSLQVVELVETIRRQRGCQLNSTPLPKALAGYLMVNPLGKRPRPRTYRVALRTLTRHIPTTEHIHPHRLRHTFATEMARAGMSVQVLMKILGHQDAKMTMQYVEVATTDLRRDYDSALEQLSVLKNLPPPPVPSPAAVPPTLEDLADLFINSLETLRRDSANTKLAAPLRRFVKRIRRANDDLHCLLKPTALTTSAIRWPIDK